MTATPATRCTCGRDRASFSHRLGRMACARCHFGSIPAADREASERGWARKDLAGQARQLARRAPRTAAGAIRDAALDLELARGDEQAGVAIRALREAGIDFKEAVS